MYEVITYIFFCLLIVTIFYGFSVANFDTHNSSALGQLGFVDKKKVNFFLEINTCWNGAHCVKNNESPLVASITTHSKACAIKWVC